MCSTRACHALPRPVLELKDLDREPGGAVLRMLCQSVLGMLCQSVLLTEARMPGSESSSQPLLLLPCGSCRAGPTGCSGLPYRLLCSSASGFLHHGCPVSSVLEGCDESQVCAL